MDSVSTDAGDGQDQEDGFHAFQCVVTTPKVETLCGVAHTLAGLARNLLRSNFALNVLSCFNENESITYHTRFVHQRICKYFVLSCFYDKILKKDIYAHSNKSPTNL